MSAAPETQAPLTVRGAVRALYDYAKGNPTDTALDAVTRTVKFRVRTDELLKRELNHHFDVGDRFRRKVAAELERIFDTNPENFFAETEQIALFKSEAQKSS